MVGVDLGGLDSGVAVVDEGGPAIDAVPVFAEASAVGEDDFDGDGEDEVTFAVDVDGVTPEDLRWIAWLGEPPLDGIGGDAVDGVVVHLGAVVGLVEDGAVGGVGDGGGGEVGEAGSGEGWISWERLGWGEGRVVGVGGGLL